MYDTHIFIFALEGNSFVFPRVLNVFQCEDKALRADGKEAFSSNAKKEIAYYPPPPSSFFQDYLNFKQHYCLSWGR